MQELLVRGGAFVGCSHVELRALDNDNHSQSRISMDLTSDSVVVVVVDMVRYRGDVELSEWHRPSYRGLSQMLGVALSEGILGRFATPRGWWYSEGILVEGPGIDGGGSTAGILFARQPSPSHRHHCHQLSISSNRIHIDYIKNTFEVDRTYPSQYTHLSYSISSVPIREPILKYVLVNFKLTLA